MGKALKYSAVLIGIYLAVYWAGGTTKVIQSGSTGYANIVKAFQGR